MSGHETTRRRFVVAVGSAAAMLAIRGAQAQMQANPAAFGAAIGKVTGGAEVKKGKVKLDVPPLSENGNTVATNVTVESPMTAKDYVKAIHLFAEKNPQPNIISVHLNPRSGKAAVSTRMRLADTQTVTAIAEMSDGSFYRASREVKVTIGGCGG